MRNKQKGIFILITIIGTAFLGCEGMATLFHGPKPEPPPVTYTVTFNANGASGTPPEAQIVNEGTIISLPGKGGMSKDTDIFAGWNESASGGTIYSIGASITITRNMVFYAQWLDSSTPQYTVTFNANGTTSGSPPSSQTVYSGISITIPGQGTLAYSGKNFGGWNTQANGGGTNYAVGATYTVTGNVTLYAKWQSAVQYTITYSANGANGTAPSAQIVDPGTEINLPGAGSMTYIGKTFNGWNTQTNGSGASYAEGAEYVVNGNVTLYAKWQDVYTVTFSANGASGAPPEAQTVNSGTVILLPGEGNMVYSGRMFDGWNTQFNGAGTSYAEGAAYTVNANITLYAKWVNLPIDAVGATLADKLTWLEANAESNNTYIITLNYDEGIGPKSLSYSGKTNVTLRIRNTVMRTISLSSNGIMFTIGAGVTLILDNNITLQGRSSNSSSLVRLISGGTLIMNKGTKITGNSYSSSGNNNSGGGVYVYSGTFTMNGGEISGNTVSTTSYSSSGGGVYVLFGNFTMNGGEISGNTVSITNFSSYSYAGGGGVYISSGTFIMNGGEISGNIVSSSFSSSTDYSYGGGVFVDQGTFTKSGGTIYGSNGDDKSNTVENSIGTLQNNRGHAVYASRSNPAKKMENTVGPGVYLFFNYNSGNPVWSGGWE